MKEKITEVGSVFLVMCLMITSISAAEALGGIWHYLFYQIIYCIMISVCVPLLFFKREGKGDLSYLGIKKMRVVDYFIILGFVTFSIGGQLIGKDLKAIDFTLLPLAIIPLLMTTFSEEFFFRGFLQTKAERSFGTIPAVLISGACFSLYHLGYPGFRSIGFIALLFLVGIMFALSYRLSNNNLIVSYFVNLPNAYLTYLLRAKSFPAFNFTKQSTQVTLVIMIATLLIVYLGLKSNETRKEDQGQRL